MTVIYEPKQIIFPRLEPVEPVGAVLAAAPDPLLCGEGQAAGCIGTPNTLDDYSKYWDLGAGWTADVSGKAVYDGSGGGELVQMKALLPMTDYQLTFDDLTNVTSPVSFFNSGGDTAFRFSLPDAREVTNFRVVRLDAITTNVIKNENFDEVMAAIVCGLEKELDITIPNLLGVFAQGELNRIDITWNTNISYPDQIVKMVYRRLDNTSFPTYYDSPKFVPRDDGAISTLTGLDPYEIYRIWLRAENATHFGYWIAIDAVTDPAWNSDSEIVIYGGDVVYFGEDIVLKD